MKRILQILGFGPGKKARKVSKQASEELFAAVERACRLCKLNQAYYRGELATLCDRVRKAIADGADVNAVYPFGSLYYEGKTLRLNVLSLAAAFGLEEIMAVLLEAPDIDLGRGVVRMCRLPAPILSGYVYNPSIEEGVAVQVAGPLSLACMQEHREIVQMLLAHKGMKRALKTTYHSVAQWWDSEPEWERAVCAAGSKFMLRMLLDFVADDKKMLEHAYKALLMNMGDMRLYSLKEITHFLECPTGKAYEMSGRLNVLIELMQERLEESKPILRDYMGSLLQTVAQRGDAATLAQLIEKMDVKGEHAQAALEEAIKSAHTECIKLLLDVPGVDVMPSLIVAAAGATAPAPLLMCLAHPTARKPLPVAAIIASVKRGRAAHLQLLLAHPEKVEGPCIDALILAAKRNSKMLELLLQAFDWSVPEIFAAFEASVLSGKWKHSRLLLEWCRKKKDMPEKWRHWGDNERKIIEKALVEVAVSQDSELLDLLLSDDDWSSDTLVSALLAAVKVQNMRNMNKLRAWCAQKNIELPQRVLDEMWISSLKKKEHHLLHLMLTDLGINVNRVVELPQGRTSALSYAVGEGKTKLVKALLAVKGIDVNNRDNHYGMTPLTLAVMLGYRDIAQLLLDAPGVDLNATDAEGRTALDLARTYKDEQLVEMLQKATQ